MVYCVVLYVCVDAFIVFVCYVFYLDVFIIPRCLHCFCCFNVLCLSMFSEFIVLFSCSLDVFIVIFFAFIVLFISMCVVSGVLFVLFVCFVSRSGLSQRVHCILDAPIVFFSTYWCVHVLVSLRCLICCLLCVFMFLLCVVMSLNVCMVISWMCCLCCVNVYRFICVFIVCYCLCVFFLLCVFNVLIVISRIDALFLSHVCFVLPSRCAFHMRVFDAFIGSSRCVQRLFLSSVDCSFLLFINLLSMCFCLISTRWSFFDCFLDVICLIDVFVLILCLSWCMYVVYLSPCVGYLFSLCLLCVFWCFSFCQ